MNTKLFAPLYENPQFVDAAAFASGIVQSFEDFYGDNRWGWDTQSAINTAGYADLITQLGEFVTAVGDPDSHDLSRLRDARNASIGYDDPNLRDLGWFMQAIIENGAIRQHIRDAASNVLNAVAASVIAKSSDGRDSSGISVFLPSDGGNLPAFYAEQYVAFDAATNWTSFLDVLGDTGAAIGGRGEGRSIVIPDWAEHNELPADAFNLFSVVDAGNAYSRLSLHTPGDVDWFRFSIGAAGGATDSVSVAAAHESDSLTVKVYDANGTTLIGESTGTGSQSVSLNGLGASTYAVQVTGGDASSVPRYTLTLNAPTGDAAAGRFPRDVQSNSRITCPSPTMLVGLPLASAKCVSSGMPSC